VANKSSLLAGGAVHEGISAARIVIGYKISIQERCGEGYED
jgi:hypothetical protein